MAYFVFTSDQDSMANKAEYVELGLACADVCRALDRGMNGKKLNDLSQPVFEAITQLTTWVEWSMHGLDGVLTTIPIAEPWRRSKGGSSNRVGGTQPLECFKQGMTRIPSRLGR